MIKQTGQKVFHIRRACYPTLRRPCRHHASLASSHQIDQTTGPHYSFNHIAPSWAPAESWIISKEQSLTGTSLSQLFANKIPSIRVPQLCTPEECELIAKHAINHPDFTLYGKNVTPPIGKLGVAQFAHQNEKDLYFEKAASTRYNDTINNVLGFDLQKRIMSQLQVAAGRYMDVEVASETADRKYYSGIFRTINMGTQIHTDWAPHEAGPEWLIGHISGQITWNVILTPIWRGGSTVVYSRQWSPDLEAKFKNEDHYAYDPQCIIGTQVGVIPARTGDLTLFNSRNMHEVKSIEHPADREPISRLTFSSFVGLLPANPAAGRPRPKLICWS
ncbi:hypothetical protein DFS34DRAFT_620513 [Phlyctochytrium arcticum]|nr:hypothetical protein DFS34DRAFT_620513 [Phlyctochytrium arcticum]